MVRYVVLWIPILVETTPEIVDERPEQIELRDVPEMQSCYLRCIADKSTKNFTLYYRLSEDSSEKEIVFTHLESTRSGFVLYKLEFNGEDDKLTESLRSSVHHSVYHYIKGLFHKHAFHDEECDSLLKGFCSDTRVKWSDNGVPKQVFTHYIWEYIDKLEQSYLTLSGELAYLQEIVNIKRQFKNGVNRSQQLKKDCFRVMGEASYAGALLRMSRFSVKNKVFSQLSDILMRLEMLREQCVDSYNTINNTYNNTLGRRGVAFGIAGIALTTILEFVHACTSDSDAIEHQDSLINRLVIQNDAELRKLKNRADSLARQNEKVLHSLESLVNE